MSDENLETNGAPAGEPAYDPAEITDATVSAAVARALAALASAATLEDFKRVRTDFTGEKSELSKLNALMRSVAPADKAAAGKLIGSARARVNQEYQAREQALVAAERDERLRAESVDVTSAGVLERVGARHPISLLSDRLSDIFLSLGWRILEGPEVESSWFNFDSLNIDPDHPAREEQDTLWVDPTERHLVLRTQTSPVQVRSLLEYGAPIYMLAPGKVFRSDDLDATHAPVFHQFEGLAIDRGLTMAHLKGTLEHVVKQLLGDQAEIRLRTNHFPFTEPSAELDVWHPGAKGGPRWIEWGGCGMVHPNVLRSAGIDPDEYQGFAFGFGIERGLMFIDELDDLRDIVEGDVRFSEQYGMVI